MVDVQQRSVIATIDVDGFPEGIAFDAGRQRVYVASWMDNAVSVIDARNNRKIGTIPTGSQSRSFGQFIGYPTNNNIHEFKERKD
ncbi:MAG TPA: hypothetical protein VIK69_03875 [Methylophilaceae bacterium]